MVHSCRSCNQVFEITEEDLAFYEKVSPVFAGKKELIPPPTLCPECRAQRRLAFRNESRLYNNHSSLSQQWLLSLYNSLGCFSENNSSPRVTNILSKEEWWDDKQNSLEYGMIFFSERSIHDQLYELARRVPMVNLVVQFNEM